jgi:5-methylcytosine-specific restriction endonuclease McrA
MKRSPIRRKAPGLKPSEVKAWQVRRWKDAEAMLGQVAEEYRSRGTASPETLARVASFAGSLRDRPRRRYRVKGEAKVMSEELDRLTKELVHRRDRGECLWCRDLGQATIGVLHAAHIRGKGAHPSMRWEPDNVITLCEHCHMTGPEAFHAPDTRPAQEWLRRYFGDLYLNRLDLLCAARKGTKTDKRAVKLYLLQKLEEL